ncbi:hypothetical protein [Streptomyces anulatus]|uniref:Uncharacterized protein n=1 Tax=Streptomyces anulatus TaxID=1892 RepID=A0ABZ1ZDJ1_STRAQ|nr:hypothetical protein [Streptomyces anulatus]
MTEQHIPPTPLQGAELELARVRAALSAGLTYEHGSRLQGSTPEELEADAKAFAAEFTPSTLAPSAPRAGGDRGPDVQGTAGTVAGGAAAYRRKHGLDEDGNRPPVPQRVNTSRTTNPFQENGYTMGAGR